MDSGLISRNTKSWQPAENKRQHWGKEFLRVGYTTTARIKKLNCLACLYPGWAGCKIITVFPHCYKCCLQGILNFATQPSKRNKFKTESEFERNVVIWEKAQNKSNKKYIFLIPWLLLKFKSGWLNSTAFPVICGNVKHFFKIFDLQTKRIELMVSFKKRTKRTGTIKTEGAASYYLFALNFPNETVTDKKKRENGGDWISDGRIIKRASELCNLLFAFNNESEKGKSSNRLSKNIWESFTRKLARIIVPYLFERFFWLIQMVIVYLFGSAECRLVDLFVVSVSDANDYQIGKSAHDVDSKDQHLGV